MNNTIGAMTDIQIPQLRANLKAKVDTGASTCCLHGTNVEFNPATKNIQFTNADISKNTINIPTHGTVAVSSADGGSDARYLVLLNVVVDGVQYDNVEFNINDRSEMDTKVLIGQNLLKMGNFVVDVAEDISDPLLVTAPVESDMNVTVALDPLLLNPTVVYSPETDMFSIQFTRDALVTILSQSGKC